MPKGTYCEVLDEMMHTKVNSSVTSSIPLAEFWQPDNLVRMQKILNPHLAGLTLETIYDFDFDGIFVEDVLKEAN